MPPASLCSSTPTNVAYRQGLSIAETTVRALSVQVTVHEVKAPREIGDAFRGVGKDGAHAAMLIGGTMFYANRVTVASEALNNRLPMMCGGEGAVVDGCLMAYSTPLPDLFRRASHLVDKILKGAKPAELPIEQGTKFELVINLKTAKLLGLTIPQSLSLQADSGHRVNSPARLWTPALSHWLASVRWRCLHLGLSRKRLALFGVDWLTPTLWLSVRASGAQSPGIWRDSPCLGCRGTAMPEGAALIAGALSQAYLCWRCIAAKTGLTAEQIDDAMHASPRLRVTRSLGPCEGCQRDTLLYRMTDG